MQHKTAKAIIARFENSISGPCDFAVSIYKVTSKGNEKRIDRISDLTADVARQMEIDINASKAGQEGIKRIAASSQYKSAMYGWR